MTSSSTAQLAERAGATAEMLAARRVQRELDGRVRPVVTVKISDRD